MNVIKWHADLVFDTIKPMEILRETVHYYFVKSGNHGWVRVPKEGANIFSDWHIAKKLVIEHCERHITANKVMIERYEKRLEAVKLMKHTDEAEACDK